jgi:aspartyl/asparaginyl beta-hydroxylase (cupin superfamily)
MTPEIERSFESLKASHGASSIERVERMMNQSDSWRHPLQKGARWILPGISQRAWLDPYEHESLRAVVRQLEEKHADIKQEFQRLWQTRGKDLGNYEHYLVNQDDWKAHYLFRKGALVTGSRALTPTAYAIVEQAAERGDLCPLLEAHFSTLLPGAVIPEHSDLWNFSINLHLAVIIPDGCSIRVGGEQRPWHEGKCLLFDYSFAHTAWNRSNDPRTCLLLDLWHPEVSLPEREALTVLVSAVRKMMG